MSFRNFIRVIVAVFLAIALVLSLGVGMGWSEVTQAGSCGPNVTRSAPPEYIKVNYYGTVYKVPFKKYVKQVMARGEWPAFYHPQALRSGAQATMQYAWYYVANPRYGCRFHVYADTRDQMWSPNRIRYPVHPKQAEAVERVWGLTLLKRRLDKPARFFATGYRTTVARTGWKLSAHRANRMARNGRSWKYITRWHYTNTKWVWRV